MNKWKIIDLPIRENIPDKPGKLIFSEVKEVTGGNFNSARRVYWIINNTQEDASRGGHYHPQGGKQEYIVCLSGKMEVELHSENKCEDIFIDKPNLALYIPCGVWHRVILSPGAVFLSVASTNFDPNESINDLPACFCGKFSK